MIMYHLVRYAVNGQFVLENASSSGGNLCVLKPKEKVSRYRPRSYRLSERSRLIPAGFNRLPSGAPFQEVLPKGNS